MSTTPIYINPVLEGIASQLKVEMDLLDAQAERVASAKATLLQAMQACPDCPNTFKVEWGQIQRTSTKVYTFRDRGVTLATEAADKAKKAYDGAKKILKAAQDAAVTVGKATLVSDTIALRIVRGK